MNELIDVPKELTTDILSDESIDIPEELTGASSEQLIDIPTNLNVNQQQNIAMAAACSALENDHKNCDLLNESPESGGGCTSCNTTCNSGQCSDTPCSGCQTVCITCNTCIYCDVTCDACDSSETPCEGCQTVCITCNTCIYCDVTCDACDSSECSDTPCEGCQTACITCNTCIYCDVTCDACDSSECSDIPCTSCDTTCNSGECSDIPCTSCNITCNSGECSDVPCAACNITCNSGEIPSCGICEITGQGSTIYTVSFDMGGHGTQVPTQYVFYGDTVTRPADPYESGYVFEGWYANRYYTLLFNFNTEITADRTIYAKWSESENSRPANWSWTSTVSKGSKASNGTVAYLTAKEWNNFTARINEFRTYIGLSTYSFTTVVKGNPMTAAQVNQARTAINAMSPPTAVPSAAVSGQSVTAAFINGLSASLNSII